MDSSSKWCSENLPDGGHVKERESARFVYPMLNCVSGILECKSDLPTFQELFVELFGVFSLVESEVRFVGEIPSAILLVFSIVRLST